MLIARLFCAGTFLLLLPSGLILALSGLQVHEQFGSGTSYVIICAPERFWSGLVTIAIALVALLAYFIVRYRQRRQVRSPEASRGHR